MFVHLFNFTRLPSSDTLIMLHHPSVTLSGSRFSLKDFTLCKWPYWPECIMLMPCFDIFLVPKCQVMCVCVWCDVFDENLLKLVEWNCSEWMNWQKRKCRARTWFYTQIKVLTVIPLMKYFGFPKKSLMEQFLKGLCVRIFMY